MGQYGRVAVRAVELYRAGRHVSPREAWEAAANELIASSSSRDKGCPRSTFLTLCGQGLVVGVPPGTYFAPRNGEHAMEAVRRLSEDRTLAKRRPGQLWTAVLGGFRKRYNGQMDVVLGLWEAGLIELDRVQQPQTADT